MKSFLIGFYFDGLKTELIPFKVACENKAPPLKIKFTKQSIDCTVYISQVHQVPTHNM